MNAILLLIVMSVQVALCTGDHAIPIYKPDKGENCECGRSTNSPFRIVNGEAVQEHSLPCMASIWHRNNFICGGTLINDRYVLTAGHCRFERKTCIAVLADLQLFYQRVFYIDELTKAEELIKMYAANLLTVYLGGTTVHAMTADKAGHRAVSDVIMHPDFVKWATLNDSAQLEFFIMAPYDMCLLKLAVPVRYDKYISPVCLPAHGAVYPEDTLATVPGWGVNKSSGTTTNIMMQTHLNIHTYKSCLNFSSTCSHVKRLNEESTFCAYKKGTDSCQGDSGGPLLHGLRQEKSLLMKGINGSQLAILPGIKQLQIGIVSWGVGCAVEGCPAAFTHVATVMPWILQHTQDANYCSY